MSGGLVGRLLGWFGVQPCVDVVDRITEYLEGTLPPSEQRAIERHLARCDGCGAALEQFRMTVKTTGRLATADVATLPDAVRAELLAAFVDRGDR